jgi:hypothetical protein
MIGWSSLSRSQVQLALHLLPELRHAQVAQVPLHAHTHVQRRTTIRSLPKRREGVVPVGEIELAARPDHDGLHQILRRLRLLAGRDRARERGRIVERRVRLRRRHRELSVRLAPVVEPLVDGVLAEQIAPELVVDLVVTERWLRRQQLVELDVDQIARLRVAPFDEQGVGDDPLADGGIASARSALRGTRATGGEPRGVGGRQRVVGRTGREQRGDGEGNGEVPHDRKDAHCVTGLRERSPAVKPPTSTAPVTARRRNGQRRVTALSRRAPPSRVAIVTVLPLRAPPST